MRQTTKRKIRVRYIVFIAVLLLLIFNEGNRTLMRRFFEQKKLNEKIKNAKRQNKLIKERIRFLENEPSYLERMVRSELNVIAPEEIEYRFSNKV
ncbi:MAG: septum formation initiator family protein [Endomicrobium sp.]|jgi:cell division protein FtsB|nr:septum formation initiator family protein [Endomicrobium sp.]